MQFMRRIWKSSKRFFFVKKLYFFSATKAWRSIVACLYDFFPSKITKKNQFKYFCVCIKPELQRDVYTKEESIKQFNVNIRIKINSRQWWAWIETIDYVWCEKIKAIWRFCFWNWKNAVVELLVKLISVNLGNYGYRCLYGCWSG